MSVAAALFRLRAYVYANNRRLRDVARLVVARRIRFHPVDGEVEELDDGNAALDDQGAALDDRDAALDDRDAALDDQDTA